MGIPARRPFVLSRSKISDRNVQGTGLKIEGAAGSRRRSNNRTLTAQRSCDRVRKQRLARCIFRVTGAVLIIDSSAVNNRAAGVEYNRVRRVRRSHCRGYATIDV